MKYTTTIFSFLLCFTSFTQNGSTCNDALPLTPSSTCNLQSFTTSSNVIWFKFTASSENINISLLTEKFGLDTPHIHNMSLYEGTCGNLVFKTEDELPFEDNADKLAIDLNASGLIIGNDYFIKADRLAHVEQCDKQNCRSNQSTLPSTFQLCVENINILIPLDFNFETPIRSHAYEQNRGQLRDYDGNMITDIKMFTKEAWPQVYISDKNTSFVWSRIDTVAVTIDTVHRVDMTLVNSEVPRNFKMEELESFNNYYLPHIPLGIVKNRSFSRVVHNNVYKGIDMQFYSNEKGIKIYFVVNKGANSDDIRLKFSGANNVAVTNSGGVNISSMLDSLVFSKALVYRINPAGNMVPMPNSGQFIQVGADEFKINVQNYPSNMPVIIQIERDLLFEDKALGDPTWSTYLGGNGNEWAYEIDSDNNGNIYVTGATQSNDLSFPFTAGASMETYNGSTDGWLGKFDVDYSQEWTTYIGGNYVDVSTGVAHDNTNNVVYISMASLSNCPSCNTLVAQPFNGDPLSFADANSQGNYIARFNSNGFREWATWLRGTFDPEFFHLTKIKTDSEGSFVVTGMINDGGSSNTFYGNMPGVGFPIYSPTPNSYQQFYHGGGNTGATDAFSDGFIAKFNSDTHLTWGTLFGGDGDEFMYNIAIDQISNDIFIVGATSSRTPNQNNCPTVVGGNFGKFPLCEVIGGYFQDNISDQIYNSTDGFVARFNKSGEMKWSTYFGGNKEDAVTGIDLLGDYSQGDFLTGDIAVISGFTSTNHYSDVNCGVANNLGFPKCSNGTGYTQNYGGGTADAFISKFSRESELVWSSYYGGSGEEAIVGNGLNNDLASGPKIHVDYKQNIFMFGNTKSGANTSTGLLPTLDNLGGYYFQDAHADYNPSGSLRTDNFVTKFNSNGELNWSTYYGGVANIEEGELAGGITTYLDRVYICGTTNSANLFPLNCPPTTGNPPFCDFSFMGTSDAYIAQLVAEGVTNVGLDEIKNSDENSLIVFPNPSNGKFTVQWNNSLSQNTELFIFNQIGQKIVSSKVSTILGLNQIDLDLSNYSKGLYIVSIESDGLRKTQKLSLY